MDTRLRAAQLVGPFGAGLRWLAALVFLMTALQPAFAGPNAPNWYLHFEVTVSGAGGKTSEDASVSWKVRHVYTGDVKLSDLGEMPTPLSPEVEAKMEHMTPAQIMKIMQNVGTVKMWRNVAPAGAIYAPIGVEIDDELKNSLHSPGEGDSFEDTKITETWKGKVKDSVENGFLFELDETKKTYNIVISIGPMEQAKTITDLTTQEINRSRYGYGGKPTHETPPPLKEMIAPSTMRIPEVPSILVNNKVHHDKDLAFAPKRGLLTFDSGQMKIDDTSGFMTSLPGTKQNVRVRVYYSLSKLPPH